MPRYESHSVAFFYSLYLIYGHGEKMGTATGTGYSHRSTIG